MDLVEAVYSFSNDLDSVLPPSFQLETDNNIREEIFFRFLFLFLSNLTFPVECWANTSLSLVPPICKTVCKILNSSIITSLCCESNVSRRKMHSVFAAVMSLLTG